jgi:hypothetical protein
MRDPYPASPDCHPELGLLLRFMEDDLRAGQRRVIARHLRQCWTCKAQLEEIRGGMCAFMEFQEQVLLPAVPIDSRSAAVREAVLRKAREGSSAPRESPLFSVARVISGASYRPAWIAAALSLASFLFFSAAMQPHLMASELLGHVESSLSVRRGRERGKVIDQRIRLRRGTSMLERNIVRNPAGTPAALVGDAPAWVPACVKTLDAPLTWDDPLAAGSFIHWRALLRSRHEDVATSGDLFTLTVVNGDSRPGGIRRMSLVVRRSDWHVVAKRMELQDAPGVEVTELGYEVRDQAPSDRLLAVSDVPIKGMAHAQREIARSAVTALSVSKEDLDKAEIDVRSALFHLRFGFGAEEIAPSVGRTPNAITIRAVISSAPRRNQLQIALAAIPHVTSHVTDTVTVSRSMSVAAIAPVVLPLDVRPPAMRPLLIQRLGGEKSATAFSNAVVEGAGKIFALAVLYRELAARYTPLEAAVLSAEACNRLGALVRDFENELRVNLQTEAGRLNPVLGEVSGPAASSAVAWQDRAERLFHLAQTHDRIVSLLFAVTAGTPPEKEASLSNPELLQRACREMTGLVSR